MKRVIFFIALCLSCIPAYSQTQADSGKDTVRYAVLAAAHYQILDFDAVKGTSYYGLSTIATSFVHWNSIHVGVNLNICMNLGITDANNVMYDLGPSVRFDISKSCFINIPVCVSTIDFKQWGCKISPAIHLFPAGKVGIFVGPQVWFDFDYSSFGMIAGLSIDV